MSNRTRIVCLHEGERGRSIDGVFINKLLRKLKPPWIRTWKGSNIIRPVSCGGRKDLISKMPGELRTCLGVGSHTTLMVWADLDDDMDNGDQLKEAFWKTAESEGVTKPDFDRVVFIFAKDRLENWIEYLNTGATDEQKEGPRIKHNREATDAADRLAEMCKNSAHNELPPSLQWSCENWRRLVDRMS